ncbi:hypothetical protein C8N31_102275 [Sulfitobacter mediterraneus]|jgi:hypothetical protein|uniref:Uncharacterized protein n=1 Tax=Sulfitobacter mediterraneus TaxID=83219 RepID=A0A2T6CI29_9RHOB|nr:hypothetical protein Z950_1471 [Sulfitobacter mediterraneus KCTC 32188]PTX75170.1 hypothetical protein C8N31_102275 [Sulfitobacter mediterraneus]
MIAFLEKMMAELFGQRERLTIPVETSEQELRGWHMRSRGWK